jgi:ribosome-associated protein
VNASARAASIARLTLTKKAYDVAVLDLRGLTTMADFFVVCSADSENQIKAVADAVEEGMEEAGEAPWHREAGSPNWVLLDYVDVVLHIFHREARSFYSLEKLWGDAAITAVTDEKPGEDLERVLEEKEEVVELAEGPKHPGKIRVQKAKAGVKGLKKGKKSGAKTGKAKGAKPGARKPASTIAGRKPAGKKPRQGKASSVGPRKSSSGSGASSSGTGASSSGSGASSSGTGASSSRILPSSPRRRKTP